MMGRVDWLIHYGMFYMKRQPVTDEYARSIQMLREFKSTVLSVCKRKVK